MFVDEEHRKILSDFLIRRMEEDKLSNNDTALRLEGKSVHISWIKNSNYWKVVPQYIWVKLQKWYESEQELSKTKPKPPMKEEVDLQAIEIEKGIPVPEHAPHGSRYPFNRMEVGDSFKVPCRERGSTHIGSAVGHFRRTHPDWKFIIRTLKEENIIRCWRVK